MDKRYPFGLHGQPLGAAAARERVDGAPKKQWSAEMESTVLYCMVAVDKL